MAIKVYQYTKCSTCVKGLKFLDLKRITYQAIPIVEQPPTLAELKKMLSYIEARGGTFKNLFNTSGVVYRELKISDQLKAGLNETQALQLLSKNGKLVKRPFLLTEKNGAVGFDPDIWNEVLD